MQTEFFEKITQGYDLHCHTNASDGSLSPTELVDLAIEYGVHTLAITDHDTVSGYQQALKNNTNQTIKLIPAVEFSTRWHPDSARLEQGEGMTLHMVALGIDVNNTSLLAHLERTRLAREQRNQKIIQRMQKKGWQDVVDLAISFTQVDNKQPTSLTRTHFANAMLELNKVTNYAQAFRKYLGKGKPLSSHTQWPSLEETVAVTKAAGGQAVLAHPLHYKLTRKKLIKLCQTFKEYGGDAIEVITGNSLKNDIDNLTGIALRTGLKGSVGSDFHSPTRFKARLGVEQDMAKTLTPVWASWQ